MTGKLSVSILQIRLLWLRRNEAEREIDARSYLYSKMQMQVEVNS